MWTSWKRMTNRPTLLTKTKAVINLDEGDMWVWPRYYETQQMLATSERGNTLRDISSNLLYRIPNRCRALLNMRRYVANLRRFYFVREHDGNSIGYRITVVELACTEWSTPRYYRTLEYKRK
jgi:hypothetical protein